MYKIEKTQNKLIRCVAKSGLDAITALYWMQKITAVFIQIQYEPKRFTGVFPGIGLGV